MALIADPYSSKARPVLQGAMGAVAAAHPLAVAAGQALLVAGGSAVDAAIAAQAALCVLAPDACGLGGDMLALVHDRGETTAVNGAGAAPSGLSHASGDGPHSITVPGIVHGWAQMSARWGRLPLAQCLAPAERLARNGVAVAPRLAATVVAQRARLLAGGGADWDLLRLQPGELFRQPALAGLLRAVGEGGASAYYSGAAAAAIAAAVQRLGGVLDEADLGAHQTVVAPPIVTRSLGAIVAVQPPMTQGVLLSMVLAALDRLGPVAADRRDHAAIELTEAAFGYRSRAGEGEALLAHALPLDLERAQRRGGPRAYLHTAGVAVSDAAGMTVSSLVSVFDDFGSCVFVPELGLTLNNRAGGFTDGPNAAAPGKRPVHTLAPAMLMLEDGSVLALATPGADGQIQTLVQVITALLQGGADLAQAVAAPRWRSEGGALLIEAGHPAGETLAALGHEIRELPSGDTRFGAVVCAGQVGGAPIAVADWRRETWAGVV